MDVYILDVAEDAPWIFDPLELEFEDLWRLKRRLGVDGDVDSFDVFSAGTGQMFATAHGRTTLAPFDSCLEWHRCQSDAGEIWAMEVLHCVPLADDASAINISTVFGGRVSFEIERLTYPVFRVDSANADGVFVTGTFLEVVQNGALLGFAPRRLWSSERTIWRPEELA